MVDRMSRRLRMKALIGLLLLAGGCGTVVAPPRPALFYVPLSVEDRSVDPAFLDTGGEFEVLLKEPYGLPIQGEISVLAYTGRERVLVTGPFSYSVGDTRFQSDGAIIGLSVCDCNGVGLGFLRKAGALLSLDFTSRTVNLVTDRPIEASYIPSSRPIGPLSGFGGLFLEVEVSSETAATRLHALLDTGATRTVIRRDVAAVLRPVTSENVSLRIGNPYLGTAEVVAGLFYTPGLPDLIIGIDLMGAWSDRWYMDFGGDEPSAWVVHAFSDPASPPATQ